MRIKLILLLALLLLCSCAGQAAITEDGDFSYVTTADNTGSSSNAVNSPGELDNFDNTGNVSLSIVPSAASGNAVAVPERWVTDKWTYFVSTTNAVKGIERYIWGYEPAPGGHIATAQEQNPDYDSDAQLLLYIYDHESGLDIVLCNRPECRHDSLDCSAVIPKDEFENVQMEGEEWARLDSRNFDQSPVSKIFADDTYVYTFGGGNTLYRFNLDGSGRTAVLRLPDKYNLNTYAYAAEFGWLMNGKLYLSSLIYVHEKFKINNVNALLEVDYIGGSFRELWAEEYREPFPPYNCPGSQATILGGFGGKMFISETIFVANNLYEGFRKNVNEQRTNIIRIDPSKLDGAAMTVIHSDTGDGYYTSSSTALAIIVTDIGDSPWLLFHSRRDGAFKRLDLLSGEISILAEDFSGMWTMWTMLNGHVSVFRGDELPEMAGTHPVYSGDYLMFMCLESGKITEITLPKIVNGELKTVWSWMEHSGFLYIEIEEVSEFDENGVYSRLDKRWGKISVEDFFANNADGITEFDWEESADIEFMLFYDFRRMRGR